MEEPCNSGRIRIRHLFSVGAHSTTSKPRTTVAQIDSRLSRLMPANRQRVPRALNLSIEAILLRLELMEVKTQVFRLCWSLLFRYYTRSSCPCRSGDAFATQERTHIHKLWTVYLHEAAFLTQWQSKSV